MRKRDARRGFLAGAAMTLAVLAGGCAASHKHMSAPVLTHPSLEATRADLVAKYNATANAVTSLNATVTLAASAGSAYQGVIEQYHEVDGFILARRPADIRVIGQAPVVRTDIFDMVSDGKTFRIYIPPKGKFITGPAVIEKTSAKPLENLRPQHLVDALLWPAIAPGAIVLSEEWDGSKERDYVLTVARQSGGTWELAQRIWFNRMDLKVSRVQNYGAEGKLLSDETYADWEDVGGGGEFPRQITLKRPHDDYELDIHITKLNLNEQIADERFTLAKPVGAQLVELDSNGQEKQPEEKRP
jgi:outer membrane lipoprotein-sorting protein